MPDVSQRMWDRRVECRGYGTDVSSTEDME